MTASTAFPSLVGGEDLSAWPAAPQALRARMAALYGVRPEQVLPTRGASHATELVLRLARRRGAETVCGDFHGLARLGAIHGLDVVATGGRVKVVSNPLRPMGDAVLAPGIRAGAAGYEMLVIDESLLELSAVESLGPLTREVGNLVVLRSLSAAYGLAGARCGAAIASAGLIAELEAVLEPHALPTPTVRLAMAALSPSRLPAVEARKRLLRSEGARVAGALTASDGVRSVVFDAAPSVFVTPADLAAAKAALLRHGVQAEGMDGGLLLALGPSEANDRILAAFGVAPPETPRRRGEAVRDTKETRIVATVDLDRAGDVSVRTGVGFFDHMLEQVAAHGGFSLTLSCEGDLHTDPHHTIEDSALALGAALKQALGDRKGIGRFGFTAPMDEAEAAVSLDLSGRPYAVFDGAFRVERIGDYPTALTAHVFRSLADSLGAAIHVRVTGADDHHKTEVCFKAFGRALRQAIRVEGGDIPSTKGVL